LPKPSNAVISKCIFTLHERKVNIALCVELLSRAPRL
jgi:hypothetical protein